MAFKTIKMTSHYSYFSHIGKENSFITFKILKYYKHNSYCILSFQRYVHLYIGKYVIYVFSTLRKLKVI